MTLPVHIGPAEFSDFTGAFAAVCCLATRQRQPQQIRATLDLALPLDCLGLRGNCVQVQIGGSRQSRSLKWPAGSDAVVCVRSQNQTRSRRVN